MKGIHKLKKHSLGHLRCWRYLLFLICSQACPVLRDWPSHPSLPFYLFSSQSSQVYKHPWEKPMLGNTPSLLEPGFISECWWSCFSAAMLLDNLPPHLTRAVSSLKSLPTHCGQTFTEVIPGVRCFPTPSVLRGQGTPNSLLHLLSFGFWPSLRCPGSSTLPRCPLLYPPSYLTFPAASPKVWNQSSVLFSTISEFLTSTFVSDHF